MTDIDIEYHADDYGMFPLQSQEILDCYQNGRLNAVSIMPNSPYLAKCMEMICPYQEKIKITVHLNFIEGHSLCASEQVNRLVDERGIFNASFGKLLLADILPGRKECRRQLCREISAQIRAVKAYLPAGAPLRIDGHAHYHMLPAVFDSLVQVIQEEGLEVEYIRFPCEKWCIYMSAGRRLKYLKAINMVKVVTLNLLAARNRRKHKRYLASMEKRVFLGVALSGTMTKENVRCILPKAIQMAEGKKCGIEILAHPGGVYVSEDVSQLTHPADIKFLTDSFRRKEKEMFCAI